MTIIETYIHDSFDIVGDGRLLVGIRHEDLEILLGPFIALAVLVAQGELQWRELLFHSNLEVHRAPFEHLYFDGLPVHNHCVKAGLISHYPLQLIIHAFNLSERLL